MCLSVCMCTSVHVLCAPFLWTVTLSWWKGLHTFQWITQLCHSEQCILLIVSPFVNIGLSYRWESGQSITQLSADYMEDKWIWFQAIPPSTNGATPVTSSLLEKRHSLLAWHLWPSNLRLYTGIGWHEVYMISIIKLPPLWGWVWLKMSHLGVTSSSHSHASVSFPYYGLTPMVYRSCYPKLWKSLFTRQSVWTFGVFISPEGNRFGLPMSEKKPLKWH